MRFLPYLLVAAMASPILIWILINNLVVKGHSTEFSGGDFWVMLSLGGFCIVAFVLLSSWMDRMVQKTSR